MRSMERGWRAGEEDGDEQVRRGRGQRRVKGSAPVSCSRGEKEWNI